MESIKKILKRIECNNLHSTNTLIKVDYVATINGFSNSHI